jgi:hypothetical protein
MFAALIPLILGIAPQIAKWLFDDKGNIVDTGVAAAAAVVGRVTGSTDATDLARILAQEPSKRMELQVELAKLDAAKSKTEMDALVAIAVAQTNAVTSTNNIEAASGKWYAAGWRPFIGWVCGVAWAWQFVVGPSFSWVFERPMVLVDMNALSTLLIGMLGLSGMRSYDKKMGTSK